MSKYDQIHHTFSDHNLARRRVIIIIMIMIILIMIILIMFIQVGIY